MKMKEIRGKSMTPWMAVAVEETEVRVSLLQSYNI